MVDHFGRTVTADPDHNRHPASVFAYDEFRYSLFFCRGKRRSFGCRTEHDQIIRTSCRHPVQQALQRFEIHVAVIVERGDQCNPYPFNVRFHRKLLIFMQI